MKWVTCYVLILVSENYRSPIDSLVDKVKKEYPSSSIVYLDRENYELGVKTLETEPLFSDRWLVLVNIKSPPESLLKLFDSDRFVTIFVFRNVDDMSAVSNKLTTLAIKHNVVDNTKVSKEALIHYVQTTLDVDITLAKYICGRHNYYAPKVMETVEFVSITGERDKEKIKKYTQRTGDVSYAAIFDYILGIGDIELKRVLSLVNRYKHGHKHLLDFIIDRFDVYLLIYRLAINGKLSYDNIKDYYDKNKDTFEKVPEYVLTKALDSMTHVSYDYLLLLSLLYKKEKTNTSLSSFIYLLKMSQEGRSV